MTEPSSAGPDRRFYAFVLDHLLVWSLYAVAIWAAYVLLIEPGQLIGGIAMIVGVVVLLTLLTALVVGLWSRTPGKALLGLRVVSPERGGPIGIGRALLRTTIVELATLPTLGFGLAALAWTAVADPSGRRRGWHDLRGRSVVVDVRPPAPVEEPVAETPQPVVNLTAMRLVPASANPPVRIPERAGAPDQVLVPEGLPEQDLSVTPRQQLGWPLVGGPPGPPPSHPPPPPPSGQRVEPHRPAGATAQWRVRFDTGESFVVAGLTLVGRRPEARQGEPVRQLVTLPSDDLSLSKTHAQFQVVPDGALVVMDRGSTNGSILIRAGMPRRLTGGRPATLRDGDLVRFGDREMTVSREG